MLRTITSSYVLSLPRCYPSQPQSKSIVTTLFSPEQGREMVSRRAHIAALHRRENEARALHQLYTAELPWRPQWSMQLSHHLSCAPLRIPRGEKGGAWERRGGGDAHALWGCGTPRDGQSPRHKLLRI